MLTERWNMVLGLSGVSTVYYYLKCLPPAINEFASFQVRIMYHDSTIGNAINIVLVRIMFLEEEEVSRGKCHFNRLLKYLVNSQLFVFKCREVPVSLYNFFRQFVPEEIGL